MVLPLPKIKLITPNISQSEFLFFFPHRGIIYDEPTRKMLEKCLCVTVNSDDPAYFGAYINENYLQTTQALNLRQDQITQLAKNSFLSSFLYNSKKDSFIAEIDNMSLVILKARAFDQMFFNFEPVGLFDVSLSVNLALYFFLRPCPLFQYLSQVEFL